MVLFGGKKETKVGKGDVPIEKVKNFLNRGFSEIEIIDLLRKEGYSPEEIDKALLQALSEIKAPQSQQLFQQPTQQTIQSQLQSQIQSSSLSQSQIYPQSQSQNIGSREQIQPPVTSSISSVSKTPEQKPMETPSKVESEIQIDYITLEEYIQYLIRERMQEINKRLMETNLKLKETEEKLVSLRKEIEDMAKGNREDLNKILNEIRINRDMVSDLSIKVEALNKTLKELLPSLIESVKLLSEIIQKLKT